MLNSLINLLICIRPIMNCTMCIPVMYCLGLDMLVPLTLASSVNSRYYSKKNIQRASNIFE